MQMLKSVGKFNAQKNLAATHSVMPVGSRFPVFQFLFSLVLED